MKILIAGSLAGVEQERHETFKSACRVLGGELAQRGHSIVVGSDNEDTADYHVVLGAADTGRPTKIIVHQPGDRERETPFGKIASQLPALSFSYRRNNGPWAAGRVHAIGESDCVVVIGGSKGTAQVGYSASVLKRSVVAVPWFGGAALDVWEVVKTYYASCGISTDEIGELREAWRPGSAKLIVDCAERMKQKDPFRERDLVRALLFLAGLLALIAIWILFFLELLPITNSAAFFILLIVSALLGTGLRSTVRSIADGTARRQASRFVTEASVGILLAFGLCLTYIMGTIVLTGDFVKLSESKDFHRVAAAFSLLGFASAYLLDKAVSVLEARLSDVLQHQPHKGN